MSANAKKWLIILGIVIIFIILIGSCVGTRNKMFTMQNEIKNKWAEVENQLKRRYDLIPNLVNTIKGYAKHEKDIFVQIADARARMAGARTPGEQVKAANGLESVIGRLLVVSENYPNLKADEQFRALRDELSGTENRLVVSRKRYNQQVTDYNNYIGVMPNNFIAMMFNFQPAELFKIAEAEKATPNVNFE